MTIKTPPLHARGLYSVKTPYTLKANTLYECMAIRTFPDIVQLGIDVFETYYQNVGLEKADYEADKKAGANIITLMSKGEPTVHLPDSYILSYPNMGNVAFNHVILSLSLGPLPDYADLTYLKQQIAETASDTIGVTPEVAIAVAPSTGVVTQEEADSLETARQAAITNRVSDHAKLLALQAKYDTLQSQYNALVEIVKDHDLIPS